MRKANLFQWLSVFVIVSIALTACGGAPTTAATEAPEVKGGQ